MAESPSGLKKVASRRFGGLTVTHGLDDRCRQVWITGSGVIDDCCVEYDLIDFLRHPYKYVSVYAVSRHYGGPDNRGGCHCRFDYTGQTERVVNDPGVLVSARLRLEASFEAGSFWPGANPDEPEYWVMVENSPGDSQSGQPS